MVGTKHVFWQALIVTVAIFGIGVMIGFFVEDSRTSSLNDQLVKSEVNLIDQQLRSRLIHDFSINCDLAQKQIFLFADQVYEEASTLERYDSAQTFKDTLDSLHRRYDLLRLLMWTESVELRQRCNAPYHTLLYFYAFNTEDVEQQATQRAFSHLLLDLKDQHPNDLLLIPVAANLNVSSVDLLASQYKIDHLPAIVVDEKYVIYDLETQNELASKILNVSFPNASVYRLSP